MIKTINYKGFEGSVNFSDEDNLYWGEVLGIDDSISYEGNDMDELAQDFHNGVESYLDFCKKKNITPQLSYQESININVNIPPEIQRDVTMQAIANNQTLNEFIESVLCKHVMCNAC